MAPPLVQIRCEGIRLFLLWLQALRDNCAEEQFLIFACLVPGFPAVPSTRGPCTLDTIIYNPFATPSDGTWLLICPMLRIRRRSQSERSYQLQILFAVMLLCVSGAAKVVPEEITPLVPAVAGEKVADDQTCFILETLLKYMVIQVSVNNGSRKMTTQVLQ